MSNRASVGREGPGRRNPGQFHADLTRWNNENIIKDQWGNENLNNLELHMSKHAPTMAKTGRLRLVRNGTTLYFCVSEGIDQDFTLLHKSDFGARDLKNVRILGSTGGPGAAFDGSITDLWIRAEAFLKPNLGLGTVEPPPPEPVRKWLVAALALSVVIVVPVGVLLYLRARQPAPPVKLTASAAPATGIGVVCPGCGKRLKARRELAGKKLKCPQCSHAVLVPQVPQEKPEETT